MTCKGNILWLSVLFAGLAAGVATAGDEDALTIYWRHEKNLNVVTEQPPKDAEEKAEEPQNGTGKWYKAPSDGKFTAKDVGVSHALWLACRNTYRTKHRKFWTITIDSNDTSKKPYKFFTKKRVYAYRTAVGRWEIKKLKSGEKLGKRNRYDLKEDGTKWTLTAYIQPQPDWEAWQLKRYSSKKDITLTATARMCCHDLKDDPDTGGTGLDFDMYIGAEDAMARDVAITQLALFPIDVPVELESLIPPSLTAPPDSGTWTYEYAFVDPNGTPRPQGGVSWSTDGPGIAAADNFEMGLRMIGQADDSYLFFAYDDQVDQWASYPLYVERDAIPTVSGWGLMLTTLLLLVAGKIYYGHRRRTRPQRTCS